MGVLLISSSMYEWSIVLPPASPLKRAVDSVICALCYIHPQFFSTLLEWMGIVINVEISAITDDHKDTQQTAMTDDSKADNEARARQPISTEESRSVGLSQPLGNRTEPSFQPLVLQEFGHMILDEAHLSTLAVACQSPEALRLLLDSGFVGVLCQGIYEFCTREMLRYSDTIVHPEVFTDAVKSGGSGSASPRSPSCGGSTRVSSSSHEADSRRRRASSESSQTGMESGWYLFQS